MLSRSGFSLGTFYQHGPVPKPPKAEGVWKGPLPHFVRTALGPLMLSPTRLPAQPARSGDKRHSEWRSAGTEEVAPARPAQDSPMNFTAARDGPNPDCLLVIRDDRPGIVRMRPRALGLPPLVASRPCTCSWIGSREFSR